MENILQRNKRSIKRCRFPLNRMILTWILASSSRSNLLSHKLQDHRCHQKEKITNIGPLEIVLHMAFDFVNNRIEYHSQLGIIGKE